MPAVTNKSFYSPYVWFTDTTTETNAFGSGVQTITGIFDYIKVVSDDATDEIQVTVKTINGDSETVHVSSGDSIHGPFTSITMIDNNDACDVFIYERSRTITN